MFNHSRLKIAIISLRGVGQSATDRFRYDVLARRLPEWGYQADYFNPAGGPYDIIILPLKKKAIRFSFLRRSGKVIIGDLTDDMLTYPVTWYNSFGRYWQMGEQLTQFWRYRRLLRQCDGVVAGSDGQAASFGRYARHVSTITDAILDSDSCHQAGYLAQKPCRLVWFGNVESLHGLVSIEEALSRLGQTGWYELRLITSSETKFRWVGHWPHNVNQFMARQRIPCLFQPWSATTCARDLAAGDIALIPVEPGSDYNWHKPAGRPLLAMALGLPVVASPLPAYQAVITSGQTGYLANTPGEWVEYVTQLATSPALRQKIGLAARSFALSHYNEENFIRQYINLIKATSP